MILICSTYEEQIRLQLIEDFCIDEKYIKTRRDFLDEFVYPYYHQYYYQRKILLLGENDYSKLYYELYQEFFNVIDFIDMSEIQNICNYDYEYVLLAKVYNDRTNREKYIADIVEKCGVPESKILSYNIFLIYLEHIEQYSNGNMFPDKIFLHFCVHRYEIGLTAVIYQVARVVFYAKEHGYIPVIDMKSYKNQYLEESEYGIINAWEKFFEQPCGYTLDDIKEAKYVLKYNGNGLLLSYDFIKFSMWYPIMIPKLKNKLHNYLSKFDNKKVLGVLFRGTDYSLMKPNNHWIQPSLNDVITTVKEKISEWGDFDYIYLCTEVLQACKEFEKEFGNKLCYYSQLRCDYIDTKFLALYNFGYPNERTRRGEDYWIALNILAKCDSLIAGQCGGSSMAININDNQYEYVYLFDYGKY